MTHTRKTKAAPTSPLRCAIYTRKSTEEGLDQDFNSLAAQREAAEAYIHSQAHAGWTALPDRYDDGGYSGSNLDRPALQRLLADIQAGHIDCVLTHRVDRLSRSLLDFARLMGTFEQHQVAFVSVTQHFHSGTSMGRLVLNVLLSFAQFERELIAERTRDKMAAARRKGKWGGGLPVLGYDVAALSKKLVVNEEEAARVRAIFALYLQHRGLLPVLAELARRGWRTKQTRTKEGHVHGGRPFTRSSLYRLLTNVTYIGQVRYRNEIHPGEQPAIIESKRWQEVQALLVHNGPRRTGTERTPSEALLQGLLFCAPCGCAMTPAQVSRGNRRYRYYTCSAAQRKGWHTCPSKSLPAGAVERYVLEQIASRLVGGRGQVQPPPTEGPSDQRRRLRDHVARIDYDGATGEVAITLNALGSSLKESA
jgi:site-specific DNA recombinase